jgi:hypothetical protein
MNTTSSHDDNLYPVGTFITAKDSPARKLVITAYKKRVYYCATVDEPERNLVYFERELIQPV